MSEAIDLLAALGVDPTLLSGGPLAARSRIDGAELGRLRPSDATAAFPAWRDTPARGAASWSACSARNCARPPHQPRARGNPDSFGIWVYHHRHRAARPPWSAR